MAHPEVIDLSDESDDDVMVTEIRNLPTQTRLPRQRPNNHNHNHNTNSNPRFEDDLMITEVRRAPQVLPVIYAPDGDIPIQGLEPTPEPERRSFQDARLPPHIQAVVPRANSPIMTRNRQEQINLQRDIVERLARQRTDEQHPRYNPHFHQHLPLNLEIHLFNSPHGRQRLAYNNFLNDMLFNNDYDEDEDPDYHPGMGNNLYAGNDDIPNHIMELIQNREAADFDRKMNVNLESTKSYEKILIEKANSLKVPYTSQIEEDSEYVCILCGTTLGVGIPEDSDPIKKDVPLELLQESYDVRAPYQALKLITTSDRDLSRRVFMAKCGHTYCGRCVKNISNVKGTIKEQKKKFSKNENNISNPFVYAPPKCVAPECTSRLTGKTTFTEIFT